jgi:hypothetical protein
MKRSAGVTVIAILSLVGSGLTFAMGMLTAAVLFFMPDRGIVHNPASPVPVKMMMLGASLVYFLPGIWGMATGIGLWQLREWARVSIIIFSALLIVMSAFGGVGAFVMPLPSGPNSSPSVMMAMRMTMGGFGAVMCGIGVWWVVFFNREKVRLQFEQFSPVPAIGGYVQTYPSDQTTPVVTNRPLVAKRPLSITIIAWLLLIGGLFTPLNLVLRLPAILFTRLLTGWPAALYFVCFAGAQLGIGIGLLRLKPWARTAGIAYYFFTLFSSMAFYLAPGRQARLGALIAVERTAFSWMRTAQEQSQFQVNADPLLLMWVVTAVIFLLIPIYFLITRKAAFHRVLAGPAEGLS